MNTPWWKERCEFSWAGPPWSRWAASSLTHIGYVAYGSTAREAVENLRQQIRRRPVNCWQNGVPLGALGIDGTVRPCRVTAVG